MVFDIIIISLFISFFFNLDWAFDLKAKVMDANGHCRRRPDNESEGRRMSEEM